MTARMVGEVRLRVRCDRLLALPKGFDVDTHFNPPYEPWDQRLCQIDKPKFGRVVPIIMGRLGLRAAWTVDRFNDAVNGSKRNARKGFAAAQRNSQIPAHST